VAVEIRAAARRDATAIAEVHVASWRAAYRGMLDDGYLDRLTPSDRSAMWSTWFDAPDPSDLLLVAVVDDGVVGFLEGGRADGDDTAPEIRALYLDPAWTCRGIGSMLLERASDTFREGGFPRAVLWVLATNAGARRFYERAGWYADGTEDTYEIAGIAYPTVRYAAEL